MAFGFCARIDNKYIFNSYIHEDSPDFASIFRLNHGLSDDCEGSFTESTQCRTSNEPEIIVWGDSYAMHLVDGLIASNQKVKFVQATISTCGPFIDVAPFEPPNYGIEWGNGCLDSNDKVMELVRNTKTIKYALLSSSFTRYVGNGSRLLTKEGKIIDGKTNSLHYFTRTLDMIRSAGVVPIVFSATPQNGNNIGSCLQKAFHLNKDPSECNFSLDSSDSINNNVIEFTRNLELNERVVWLSDGICPDRICNVYNTGNFIYRDEGHLSHEGSVYIGKMMNFYKRVIDHSSSK